MKPSRALYLAAGYLLACSVFMPIPGPGGLPAFFFLVCGAAALAFDWNNA